MAGETHSDRIRQLERENSTIVARLDNLGRDIERAEGKIEAASQSAQDQDKRLAVLADRLDRLEKSLEEMQAKRWDVWKILLGAILGCLLTLAAGLASRWLERQTSPSPAASERR